MKEFYRTALISVRLRRVTLGVGVERFRQPEVQHFDGPVLAHLDVGRLEVPMDHPRFVRRSVGAAGDHPDLVVGAVIVMGMIIGRSLAPLNSSRTMRAVRRR